MCLQGICRRFSTRECIDEAADRWTVIHTKTVRKERKIFGAWSGGSPRSAESRWVQIDRGARRDRQMARGINEQLGVDCFECPTLPGSVNFIEDFEQDRDSGSLGISGRMWRGVVLNNIQTCGGKPVYTRRRTCKS